MKGFTGSRIRLRVNLGTLVLASTLALVILFASLNFYWIRRETTQALAVELERRALHVAQGLAFQVADAMLLEDRLLLGRLLTETISMDPEVEYIFLVGPDGSVIAHTYEDGFPVELLTANPLPPGRDYMVRRVVDKQGRGEPLRDVVVPVAGGYGGFAHVGLRESLILGGVRRVERAVGVMVAVFLLVGLGATLVFTRVVTDPLQRLAAASRALNLEILQGSDAKLPELSVQLASTVPLETEVDRFASEFRQMVDRLSTAYRELRMMQGQLVVAERLSTIGTIAAGVAHELNNPLAGLKNCLRRIQREPDNREQLSRYLVVMQDSVERMRRVVQELLDLSRPRPPELQAVALEPLLDRVILLAGHRLAEIRATPVKEIGPEAAVAWADQYQLEQALLNLVLNACDALEQRVERDPGFSPRLVLRGRCHDGRLHIEVEDNGVGIQPDNLERIFDQFFTTKAPGRGTGLGLSIARSLIREHGGDIVVDARPGGGANFRVLLGLPRTPGGENAGAQP